MKNIYYRLKSAISNKRSNQAELIDFVSDKKNIHKAVEGSMQKRIDLINRVTPHKNSV